MRILVTGATGQQGGAVADELLSRGDHEVCILTRRPDSERSAELQDQGAEVYAGDLTDLDSLRRAAEGVDGIFGVTTPFESGMEAEVVQGDNLVDVASQTGARLVFSSVGWAYANTGIPHFESKWQVEQRLRSTKVPHTILGPSFFMANIVAPWSLPALKSDNIYAVPMSPAVPVPIVALQNIADMAILAFENPDRLNGHRLDLAGDIQTGAGVAEILAEITGRPIRYYEVPKAQVESEDLRLMYEWYENKRPTIDLGALQKEFPEVHWYTCREWAESQNWMELLGG